jgi:anaphase-promoting complex subunit 8
LSLDPANDVLLLSGFPEVDDESDAFLMAKSYFDLREFDRCAFFTKDCKSERAVFLHYYSRYMSGEKKRLDNATDFIANNDCAQLKYLRELRQEMEKMHANKVECLVFALVGVRLSFFFLL